jgi:spore germination protein YaaH
MGRQVFQTDSKSRWKRFKWSFRFIAFILILLVAVFITMLIVDNIPSMPFKQDYVSVVTASRPYLRDNKLAKEYKGFRYFFKEKKAHNNYAQEKKAKIDKMKAFSGKGASATQKYVGSWNSMTAGVRSAFYVTWDPKSYISLKQNIGKLNLVIPEWYFINPNTAQVETKIDPKGYELMKKSAVPIMPILSNNYHQQFNGKGIGVILHHPVMRQALIKNLLNQCLQHGFIGINLDLEELQENNDEYLIAFVKEISQAFHAKGLYVTQDIEPFNTDYNVKELAKYDDYLFIMAYDEHSITSTAGPISSQQWIEAAVDDVAKKIPEEKIVLCMGAYGYDWTPQGDENTSLSYRDALSIASDTQAQIDFDNNTYNLSFAYEDDNNTVHQIFFNDAATHFNTMRFGAEYGLAGFSVWRLGTEDSRLWSFYSRNLDHEPPCRTHGPM